MKLQVLIATMYQNNCDFLTKMNIQTDAIVGNQTNNNSVEDLILNGHNIKFLSFNERGVGLNRNNCLMRANADICLFADDDMIYVDDYNKIVINEFINNPKADVLIFNLYENNSNRFTIKKKTRVRWWNYLRYGTARVGIRLNSVKSNNIYFNQCFGGGTEHCHGEDNIFLHDCLKKKLKIYAIPVYIATLTNERDSTWSNVSNEKYLHDQGVLFQTISKRFWKLLCLQDAIRHHQKFNISFIKMYNLMVK